MNPLNPKLCKKYPISVVPRSYDREELESFIRFYVPRGWVGPISDFDFAPYVTEEEFKLILTGVIPSDQLPND